MIRRPPRSTQSRSSAASDVYKRQDWLTLVQKKTYIRNDQVATVNVKIDKSKVKEPGTVSYTHLRAHETVLDLVCRLLLEKKKHNITTNNTNYITRQK